MKEQASEFDAGELMEARLAIRSENGHSTVTRVQDAYGERYNPIMMFDSKRDVVNLLREETEHTLSGNTCGESNSARIGSKESQNAISRAVISDLM